MHWKGKLHVYCKARVFHCLHSSSGKDKSILPKRKKKVPEADCSTLEKVGGWKTDYGF